MAKEHREPLFHIVKRGNMSTSQKVVIKVLFAFIGLIFGAILVCLSSPSSHDFFGVFGSMGFSVFSSDIAFWPYMKDVALLLGVSIALIPAFKMKFWNLGGNGQILIGCLCSCLLMYYLGGKLPEPVLWILMFLSSIVGAAIWAVIPALFKVFFRTNESLFTLMLNYVALNIVYFFVFTWTNGDHETMDPLDYGHLPSLSGSFFSKYIFFILIFFIIAIAMYFYLKYSKQGYELSVVGESENTARYIGINVSWVTIRTVAISGALCGFVGFILTGGINFMMGYDMDANMGFTGILVAWLSNFNPFIMIFVAMFVVFIKTGMAEASTDYGITNSNIASIVTGVTFFLLIASEFIVSYRIIWKPSVQNVVDKISRPFTIAFEKTDQFFKNIIKKMSKKEAVASKEEK